MSGEYFPPESEMVATLAPLVTDAAEQLGSRASLYHVTRTRQADASYYEKRAAAATYNAIAIRLTELTNDQAQEIFGLNTNVSMQGSMHRSVPVVLRDVFVVTSGDFSGRSLQVASMRQRPLSDSYLLGLVDYEGAV